MKHVTMISRKRIPAAAAAPTLKDCVSYLVNTWDFAGFMDCWSEKKGCNCGDETT
ncbi:MAG: hypothetical protein IT365_00175 [Candidatus Hydrogenedentes bacterium]|nr:hypothetical protein [Candidatus Hydrogenedentota bacterium]